MYANGQGQEQSQPLKFFSFPFFLFSGPLILEPLIDQKIILEYSRKIKLAEISFIFLEAAYSQWLVQECWCSIPCPKDGLTKVQFTLQSPLLRRDWMPDDWNWNHLESLSCLASMSYFPHSFTGFSRDHFLNELLSC